MRTRTCLRRPCKTAASEPLDSALHCGRDVLIPEQGGGNTAIDSTGKLCFWPSGVLEEALPDHTLEAPCYRQDNVCARCVKNWG